MPNLGKVEFAKKIKVSTSKLDIIMDQLGLEYLDNPRDFRTKMVTEADQKIISTYLDTGEKPEKDSDKKK